MGKWLFYVETNCFDKNREEEFNRWYDEIHISDVMKGCENFVACRRYKINSDTKEHGEYLAIIEIEKDNVDQTMEKHKKNSERIREEGRWTNLIQVVSRKLYKLDKEL